MDFLIYRKNKQFRTIVTLYIEVHQPPRFTSSTQQSDHSHTSESNVWKNSFLRAYTVYSDPI